jgi:hypothetical protein
VEATLKGLGHRMNICFKAYNIKSLRTVLSVHAQIVFRLEQFSGSQAAYGTTLIVTGSYQKLEQAS